MLPGKFLATSHVARTETDTFPARRSAKLSDPLTRTTQGISVVTWSFDDGHGNVSAATQRIVVQDTLPPVAPLLYAALFQSSATITVAPTTTDNCGGTITGTTSDPLTRTTQGISVVTWSFDDGHGNVSAATQRIVVQDTLPPVAPVLADVTGQCSATITAAPTTTDK